jgi:heme exporter protein D
MFCLDVAVVCRCVSSTDVFLSGSSWSCIDLVSDLLACRYMGAFSPCIWEKCCVLYVVVVKLLLQHVLAHSAIIRYLTSLPSAVIVCYAWCVHTTYCGDGTK